MNLTQNPADDFQAVWSPTGEQILFVSDRNDGIYDLYLMNSDGSDIRRVFKEKEKLTEAIRHGRLMVNRSLIRLWTGIARGRLSTLRL